MITAAIHGMLTPTTIAITTVVEMSDTFPGINIVDWRTKYQSINQSTHPSLFQAWAHRTNAGM